MSKAFVAGFAVAAALAAAGWFLRVVPERDAGARRAADAEEGARRAKREAADAQQWAETERERNRLLDDKVKELERLLTTTAPPPPPEKDPKHPPEETPEQWNRPRLNQEIENLVHSGAAAGKHQRYPLVVRAMRSRQDESVELLSQILRGGFDASYAATAATLAIGLGDVRVVAPLLERWRSETDLQAQAAILRALANLPGDEQVEVLVRAWTAEGGVAQHHLLALHGLALRGHALARDVAKTRGAATPQQRVRAIETLLEHASRGRWADATLVPVFGAALRSADGPAQRKLSLIALEGFWSKDAEPDLGAFADDAASPPELAARARKVIADVAAGKPRPENAGVPERGLVPDADDVAPARVPDAPR